MARGPAGTARGARTPSTAAAPKRASAPRRPSDGRRPDRPRRRRFSLRDWSVRAKIDAVLAIPAVAFLVVAGVGAMSLVQGAHDLDDLSRHVAFCRPVTSLVHELQRERDRTEGYLVVAARGDVSTPAAKPLAEALSSDRRAVNRAVAA